MARLPPIWTWRSRRPLTVVALALDKLGHIAYQGVLEAESLGKDLGTVRVDGQLLEQFGPTFLEVL